MLNLLTETLLRFDKSDRSRAEASLPEVYAALMADEVEAFPALRPHQRHAWHAFLVQLGVIAIHQTGLSEPPDDAGEWRRIIRALTESEYPDDEPWQLGGGRHHQARLHATSGPLQGTGEGLQERGRYPGRP